MIRFGALLLCMIVLSGCLTRAKIDAAIWLNNGLPADLCEKEPELKDYGFYRKLDSGQLEFVAFCDPRAREWLSMHKDDFNKLMDEAGIPPASQ